MVHKKTGDFCSHRALSMQKKYLTNKYTSKCIITNYSKYYEEKVMRNHYKGPILDWKVRKGLSEDRIF